MIDDNSVRNRPAYQVVAGRVARLFGIQFFDLYYGQKNFSSPSEAVLPEPEQVRLATPDDLEQVICRIGEEVRDLFDLNIAMNSRCYVAVHEGMITGYLWVNRKIIELLGMHLADLPPGVSFVHGVFVFPEHRRKNVFQVLFRTACHELQKDGFHSVTCFVDRANTQSVEAFRKVGVEFHSAPVLKLPGIKPVFSRRALA